MTTAAAVFAVVLLTLLATCVESFDPPAGLRPAKSVDEHEKAIVPLASATKNRPTAAAQRSNAAKLVAALAHDRSAKLGSSRLARRRKYARERAFG